VRTRRGIGVQHDTGDDSVLEPGEHGVEQVAVAAGVTPPDLAEADAGLGAQDALALRAQVAGGTDAADGQGPPTPR
jgi:hypothetical protein